jgi:hypothetical protein
MITPLPSLYANYSIFLSLNQEKNAVAEATAFLFSKL